MSNLKSFGLKNFRVFKNQTDFELAPITIVTGTNNAGKSSLSKALLLLSDTLSTKKLDSYEKSPLRPFGFLDFSRNDLHHLGGLKYVSNQDNKEIVFTLDMDFTENVKNPNLGWKLEISYCNNPDIIYLYGGVQRFRIYKTEKKKLIELVHINVLMENSKTAEDIYIEYQYNFRYIFENFFDPKHGNSLPYFPNIEFYKKITDSDLDSETGILIVQLLIDVLCTKEENGFSIDKGIPPNYMLEFMGSLFFLYGWESEGGIDETIFLDRLIKKLKKNGFNINENFLEKENWIVDYGLKDNLKNFKENIFEGILLKNIESCIYKFQQMIYIPKEKISLNRIHSRYSGDSYIYKEKDQLLQNSISGTFYNQSDFELEKKWLKEFGIKNFHFEDIEGSSFKLSIVTDSSARNMADVGYGIGQIATLMYILFSIKKSYLEANWKRDNPIGKRIIIIEEPEAGLHPHLQSKLADFFVELQQEFGFQFIIETHSEYLIRKLQLLTAQKKIKSEDTIIHYLFHHDSEHTRKTKEQLRTIRIKENGCLDKEFGSGFLDEADYMALSIYQINMN